MWKIEGASSCSDYFLLMARMLGQQTAESQTMPLDSEIIIFVAIVFGVGLAVAGITAFKLKTKLKVRSSRMNN